MYRSGLKRRHIDDCLWCQLGRDEVAGQLDGLLGRRGKTANRDFRCEAT